MALARHLAAHQIPHTIPQHIPQECASPDRPWALPAGAGAAPYRGGLSGGGGDHHTAIGAGQGPSRAVGAGGLCDGFGDGFGDCFGDCFGAGFGAGFGAHLSALPPTTISRQQTVDSLPSSALGASPPLSAYTSPACASQPSLPPAVWQRELSSVLGADPTAGRNQLTRKEWTADEDTVIISGVAAHGPRWRLIAAELPGRSDDAVRNRHKRLMKDAEMRVEILDVNGKPIKPPPRALR